MAYAVYILLNIRYFILGTSSCDFIDISLIFLSTRQVPLLAIEMGWIIPPVSTYLMSSDTSSFLADPLTKKSQSLLLLTWINFWAIRLCNILWEISHHGILILDGLGSHSARYSDCLNIRQDHLRYRYLPLATSLCHSLLPSRIVQPPRERNRNWENTNVVRTQEFKRTLDATSLLLVMEDFFNDDVSPTLRDPSLDSIPESRMSSLSSYAAPIASLSLWVVSSESFSIFVFCLFVLWLRVFGATVFPYGFLTPIVDSISLTFCLLLERLLKLPFPDKKCLVLSHFVPSVALLIAAGDLTGNFLVFFAPTVK